MKPKSANNYVRRPHNVLLQLYRTEWEAATAESNIGQQTDTHLGIYVRRWSIKCGNSCVVHSLRQSIRLLANAPVVVNYSTRPIDRHNVLLLSGHRGSRKVRLLPVGVLEILQLATSSRRCSFNLVLCVSLYFCMVFIIFSSGVWFIVTVVIFVACTFVTCFNKDQSINKDIRQWRMSHSFSRCVSIINCYNVNQKRLQFA